MGGGGEGGYCTKKKKKKKEEIITENFPSLQKEVGFQTQEAYTTPGRHIQRGHLP